MLTLYLSLVDSPEEKDKVRALYEKYHNLMMYVAVQILKNQSDAEDAVHQAFLSLIKNCSKISKVECPETKHFCVIVTRNKCYDIQRKQKREVLTENEDAFERTADFEGELNQTSDLVSDDPSLFEGCSPAVRALQKLNERYRTVLYLRYVDGYKTKVIAKMLGINEAAAQKMIWRAKEALKNALEEVENE